MVFGLKTPSKKKDEEKDTFPLDDQFQFNIGHVNPRFSDDDAFIKAINDTNQALYAQQMPTFDETSPYLTLFGMETLITMYRQYSKDTTISNAVFFEYGELPKQPKKKKGSEPVRGEVDSYTLSIPITENTTHVPQLIAEFIFNLQGEAAGDAGYDEKKAFVTTILEFYNNRYGMLFQGLFGMRPIEAIEYPSERTYAETIAKGKYLPINGLIDDSIFEEDTIEDNDVSNDEAQPQFDDFGSDFATVAKPEPETHQDEQPETFVPNMPVTKNDATLQPLQNAPQFDDVQRYLEDELTTGFDVNAANIEVPMLPVEASPAVPAYHDDYPDYKISEFKSMLNEERLSIEDQLNKSSRSRLEAAFGEFRSQIRDAVAELHTLDVLEVEVTRQVDEELQERLRTEMASRTTELDQSESDEIAKAKQNYEAALKKIEDATSVKRNSLRQVILDENEAMRTKNIEEAMTDGKCRIDKKQRQLIDEMVAKVETKLQPMATNLQSKSQEFITSVVTEQNERLAEFTAEVHNQHNEAIRTNALHKRAEREAQVAQEVDQATESMVRNYKETVEAMSEMKRQNEQLEAENRTYSKILDEHDQPKVMNNGWPQMQMMPMQMPVQQAPAPTSSGLKMAVVGLAAALGLIVVGGGGYLVYQSNQTANETQKQLAALQAANKSEHSESKAVSSTTPAPTDQAASATSTNFDALDIDVANGSLNIYNTSFKNKDLQTEARVLAVGTLLIKQGDTADSKALADANAGHNTLLLQQLGS
jgi:hypothetical protein